MVNILKEKKTISIVGNVYIIYIFLIISLFIIRLLGTHDSDKKTMLFYAGTIVIVFLLNIIGARAKEQKITESLLLISLIILVFVLGFRNQSGIDDFTYKRIFFLAKGKTLWNILILRILKLDLKY